MLTADIVEFVMGGVLSGRIPRLVGRLLVSPFVAPDGVVESGLVLAGAWDIHGFAMAEEGLELCLLDPDSLRITISYPESVAWKLSDDEVRERVEKWRALRRAVGDKGTYSVNEGRWVASASA